MPDAAFDLPADTEQIEVCVSTTASPPFFLPGVVHYTKLMAAGEKSTLTAMAACMSMLRGTVARHGGRVFKEPGDGTLSEFGSTIGAMQAAPGRHGSSESRQT